MSELARTVEPPKRMIHSGNGNMKIHLVSRCAWTLYNFRSGLIRDLMNSGFDVLGAGAGSDGFEEKLGDMGVPFVDLPMDKRGVNPVSDLKLLHTLYLWYRKERPDIVHHFTIKPVIYGSIAAKYAGVPKIVNTITGLGYVFTQENRWLKKIVHMLYRFALKGADFTFFQNSDDQAYFLSHRLIVSQNTCVLPGSGVDCERFRPVSEGKGVDTGRGSVFLMLSRLLKDKGVHEFVQAARTVKQVYPEVVFRLLGRRDERNPSVVAKEDLMRWQSEGIVEWLGEVEDVRPVIAKADVVVLPSYREGVPRSLLEAAAMGKPVITTDAVGCREAVEHECTGLLVPVKDAKALADAMARMVENPGMRVNMGQAGRKKVKREFAEPIVINKIIGVYNELGG